MACERYEDLLQEHLDRGLGNEDVAELKRHLDLCSRCRADSIMYRKLLDQVEATPEVEAPTAAILAGVMAALDREPAPRPAYVLAPPLWARAVGVAAVGVVAVLLYVAVAAGPVPVGPASAVPQLAQNVTSGKALVPPAPAVVPRAVARFVAGAGEAEVLRQGATGWVAVRDDLGLELGDRVRATGERAQVLYGTDDARLILRQGTEVQILAGGVRLRIGDAWIKVRKGAGTHFFAETPNAVASVRGTVYTVTVAAGATHVNVFEGLVEVRPGTLEQSGMPAAMVAAGQCVDVAAADLGQVAQAPASAYRAYSMDVPADVAAASAAVGAADAAEPPVDATVGTLSTEAGATAVAGPRPEDAGCTAAPRAGSLSPDGN